MDRNIVKNIKHTEKILNRIIKLETTLAWQELEQELNKLLLTKMSGRERNVIGKWWSVVGDIIVLLTT